MSKHVSLRLADEVFTEVDRRASAPGRSVSAVINECLALHLGITEGEGGAEDRLQDLENRVSRLEEVAQIG